jgi:hypothetical protein
VGAVAHCQYSDFASLVAPTPPPPPRQNILC